MKSINQMLDEIGLFWLLVLYNEKKYFQEYSKEDKALTDEFEARRPHLVKKSLQAVISELSRLRDEEDHRYDNLEAKASSLISLTGFLGTIVLGIASLSDKVYDGIRLIIVPVYCTIVLASIVTVALARRAIQVGKAGFAYPDFSILWNLTDQDEDQVYQQQAKAMLVSYIYNRALINDKAQYVAAAQKWFRNTIVLLLLMTLMLGLYVLFGSAAQNLNATPTNIPFTSTVTASNTPSSHSTATSNPTSSFTPQFTPSSTP